MENPHPLANYTRGLTSPSRGLGLCSSILKPDLSPIGKTRIAGIAERCRIPLQTGERENQVSGVDSRELFGQFKLGNFPDQQPEKFPGLANTAFVPTKDVRFYATGTSLD